MNYKTVLYPGILVIGIGLVGAFALYDSEEKTNSHNQEVSGVGLEVPGHENLKDLTAETELILVADVPAEYEIIETPIEGENSVYMVDHKYQITVEKNLKSPSGTKFKKRDVLDLIVSIGMRQKLNEIEGELIPLTDDLHEFSRGEYLLFLEVVEYAPLDKKVVMFGNLNHIYRKEGDKFSNVSSELIPIIDENEEFEN